MVIMRYLRKRESSEVLERGWRYSSRSQRPQITRVLLAEQKGFCAYSERYRRETDEVHIEHFDPRKKNTEHDDYWNWFVVLAWFNHHKPYCIAEYEPLACPYDSDLPNRIGYEDGEFIPVSDDDVEARNLIEFLGWNSRELFDERANHIEHLREIREILQNEREFVAYLNRNPRQLDFFTAIHAEFGIAPDQITHLV
jgi:hypothetical protein